MSPAKKSHGGPRRSSVDLNSVTAVIFIVTMIALATLALEIRVLELQNGPSGSGSGHGGSGSGNGTGKGKGAGSGTTASDGGDGASGVNETAKEFGYGPGGGGNAGMVTPKPVSSGQREKPVSTPSDHGDGAAGEAERKAIDLLRPTYSTGGVRLGTNKSTGGGGGGGGHGVQIPNIQLPDKVKWLLVVIMVLVIGVAVVFIGRAYMRTRRDALKKAAKAREKAKQSSHAAVAAAVAEDLIETLDMTYDSLEKMGDVRKAIVLCYARMCKAVSDRGLARTMDITPREFHAVIKTTFGVEAGSVKDLTRIFEEAVYSEHAMGEEQRARALKMLKETEKEVRSWQT